MACIDFFCVTAANTHRDTKNHTMLCRDRHLGGQLTTNALMFTAPNQFDKPEFARKPLIRWVGVWLGR